MSFRGASLLPLLLAGTCTMAGFCDFSHAAPPSNPLHCGYGGEQGTQRICPVGQSPDAAVCDAFNSRPRSVPRTSDCCNGSFQKTGTAKRSNGALYDVFQCVPSPALPAGKPAYVPRYSQPAQATRWYQAIHDLNHTGRYEFSPLGVDVPPTVPPTPTPTSIPTSIPTSTPLPPPVIPRAVEATLRVNPQNRSVPHLSDAEKSALSATAATGGGHACGYVDLREKGFGPVREQDGIGWCYAFTATDLLGFRYQQELGGAQISAVDVSMRYIAAAKRTAGQPGGMTLQEAFGPNGEIDGRISRLEGGTVNRALLEAMKSPGVCTEAELSSRNRESSQCPNNGGPLKSNLECIESLVLNPNRVTTFGDACQLVLGKETVIRMLFPQLKLDDVANAVLASYQTQPTVPGDRAYDFLQSIRNRGCAHPFKAPEPVAELVQVPAPTEALQATPEGGSVLSDGQADQVLQSIDQTLDQGQPLGLSYHIGLILEKNQGQRTAGDGHGSVVAGRRWNPSAGKCEYMIRNSFGVQCPKTYRSSLVSDIGANPREAGSHCQGGYLWVPEAEVKQYAISVSHLK